MCKLCEDFIKEHPHNGTIHTGTSFGSPIRCAFTNDGMFTSDNWNCRTMSVLRGACYNNYTYRDDMDAGSIGICHIPENDIISGYVVLTYYKDRGKTGSATIVYDDETPKPLTLEMAEAIIDVMEAYK